LGAFGVCGNIEPFRLEVRIMKRIATRPKTRARRLI
jgi:hypothetical protein